MRATTAAATLVLLVLAGRAVAIVSMGVVDATVTLAEVAPSAGSTVLRLSTTDGLRFSNEGSTEAELLVFSATHSFRYDKDNSTTAGPLSHQGVAMDLADSLFAAQSSAGAFLPLRVATSWDQTGQAGWTKNAGCATVGLQGQWNVSWYSNAGAAQATMVRYYQVCDGATEVYVDADKDLSSGADLAYASTTSQVLPAEADYEVVLQGTDFAFTSVSGATVALQQARYVPSALTSPTTTDLYFLARFPDGFPAGVLTSSLAATATDIVST